MAEVIVALNGLTWPGAFGLTALTAGAVGISFAFVAWWRS